MQISARRYEEGDEYGVIELFKDIFYREMTIEEWRWKYKGRGNEKVYSTVLLDEANHIVGHYGGISLKMIHEGKEIKGVAICDVMIHPKFRGFTRLKKLHHLFMEELIKDSITMVYGFPTEITLMLPAEKLGLYERVEVVKEATKSVQFSSNSYRFFYELSRIGFGDERIDELWDDVKPQLQLALIRDKSYLKWRYNENPLFTYELWGLRKRWSKKLFAIVVLKREQETLIIMDIIFRKHILPILLLKIETLAHSIDMKRLTLWGMHQTSDLLKEKGFSFKTIETTLTRTTHPATIGKNEMIEKFFYTMGDTDYL